MALSRTNLLGQITGGSGNWGTGNWTTSSFTPPSSSLLVVGASLIENSGSTTDPLAVWTISDSVGLTWTPAVSAVVTPTSFPTATRIWTAPVTTGALMTLTLSTGGRTIGEYCLSVVAYTGYNTGSPTAATGSKTQNGGFPGPPTPYSFTLTGPPAATSEVFAVVGMDKTVAGCTPGSTFVEVDELENASWGGLESEARTGSTSTTVDWVDLRSGGGALFNAAAVAVEIQASTTPPFLPAPLTRRQPRLDRLAARLRAWTPLPGRTLRDLTVTVYPAQTKWRTGAQMPASISTASLEYIRVPVAATAAGTAVDPTSDSVAMAFLDPTATPAAGDWKAASWDTTPVNGVYYAQCLIGPGGAVALTAGQWQVWVKVTDSPEIPAKPASILQVY